MKEWLDGWTDGQMSKPRMPARTESAQSDVGMAKLTVTWPHK